MATESSVTKRCLLCRRALPRGGFLVGLADILLSPLCADCQRRCSTDPHTVVAEHPQLFDVGEVTNLRVYPTSPTVPLRPRGQSERPVAQPASPSNVAGSGPPHVIVTDSQTPFRSMVGRLVPWAMASIPAVMILFFLGVIVSAFFGSFILELGAGARPFGR
jgi:hypothetical protein